MEMFATTVDSVWVDKSDSIDALAKSLVKALGEMQDVTKTQTANAGQFAYTYATLGDALQMARPILAKHGLALTQSIGADEDDVVIFTTVLHESGQYVTAQPLRLAAGKTAQQVGSACTYGRRYAVMAFLGLATEDDDGAQASPRVKTSASPSRKPAPVTNDSRGQSVDSRSDEETQIRSLIVGLDANRQREIRVAFKEQFGSSLTDLSVERHSEALKWIQAFA